MVKNEMRGSLRYAALACGFGRDDGVLGPVQMLELSEATFFMDGLCLVRDVIDAEETAMLIRVTERNAAGDEMRGGVRNLLDVAEFRALAESLQLRKLVDTVLGGGSFAVRGILFDKNDGANWKVPWHQDVTIAVTDRVDAEGYGPWSVKAGVVHVQPPASVLEKMVSGRIHLDDCPAENGALRVLPGTHRAGKLSQQEIDRCAASIDPLVCEAGVGDVLILQPLLVHASSAASLPRHRRVVHFDYANVELADGLQWREPGRPTHSR